MTTEAKKIDGFSLENILQIFSLEKKSQTIRVVKEDNVGWIDIDNGEIIHAEFKNMQGVEAAKEIISWDDVQLELVDLRQCNATISQSLINILLEVSRIKDEKKSLLEESGEGLLVSAIEKAERQQYGEAHKDIVPYLKKNKNNAKAWVWYSRIQGNTETMKKALKMAINIDANDELVKEEKQKYAAVARFLTEDVVKKCHFCWSPLNKNTTICHYCRARLVITKEAFSHHEEINAHFLSQARQRYERILKKYPRSLIAVYCLGLIHINSKNYQEALAYLDKAAKMAPDKLLFSNQLKLLLDYLARRSTEEKKVDLPQIEESVSPAAIVPAKDVEKVILVVEDSATTRKVVSITLSRQGYRVVEAADGLEALSKISEERPDLIMLDVILPKMDGYKILSIIKGNKEFRDIPVIMLTSKDGFINKMKGKMAGATAYLTKPFDPDTMIAEIKKHI